MAGLFAHVWIANLVLQKLSKKGFISKSENIDDYFFGSIAPDIRYVSGSGRDITHRPKGEKSIFEALKVSSVSMPFTAGYETHLVVDDTWSNDNNSMGKSIYEYYSLDANDAIQKYSLYLLVDDYFQGESDWFFKFATAGNILRANDLSILKGFGFNEQDISKYKFFVAGYLREPGTDTINVFNVFPNYFDETAFKVFADSLPSLTSFLKEFKKVSTDKCIEAVEKYI